MATTQQTQQQGIEITSQALPSDGLSRFVRAGAWPAPDLARQSSLVFGRDPRTHRPRRGHGWLQYPPWRPCSEFGYAPAWCRALPSLLQLPRQCTGRGDRVAGYVLPRLQSQMSALSASLILAPIWALWHLPLWLTGAPG
jgi:hypothetical protein